MAEFTSDHLEVRFTLPDKVTVRQQLQYKGRAFNTGLQSEDVYVRHWVGVQPLIGEWTSTQQNKDGSYKPCTAVPDPANVDLDKETDPIVADIVFWASNLAANHMAKLETVPKNS